MQAGKMFQKDECSVEPREEQAARSPTSVIPPAISQREPIRSESFPAIGATRMISIVIGRNVAPAWIGE